jgi:uncharacterized protein YyaL (SSP411 family)
VRPGESRFAGCAGHFEKMLYDNAQLARVYLHAWQVTGNPFFRTVAEEIMDYIAREMTDPAGGFYSTQDADSEGVEGKFFLWRPAEIRALLGDEAERFAAAYGVTEAGNFEGENVLTLVGPAEERNALAAARQKLLAARNQRVHPRRDDKILISWNGLMLAAFAEAARALGRDDYRQVAERNADFLLRAGRGEDGRLSHIARGQGLRDNGPVARDKLNGYLEDYSHLLEGLLELYQTTFEPRWYAAARELAETMVAHFRHPDAVRMLPEQHSPSQAEGFAGFYDTSDDHEALVARPRDLQDNATPSGNGMAAYVLPRLAGLAVEPRYRELAEESVRSVQPLLAQYPLGFGQWLIALDYLLASTREIAIVGDPTSADVQALLAVTCGYHPHQVVAAGSSADVPLLAGRPPLGGHATAYLCAGSVCRAPVTEPEELHRLLTQS